MSEQVAPRSHATQSPGQAEAPRRGRRSALTKTAFPSAQTQCLRSFAWTPGGQYFGTVPALLYRPKEAPGRDLYSTEASEVDPQKEDAPNARTSRCLHRIDSISLPFAHRFGRRYAR